MPAHTPTVLRGLAGAGAAWNGRTPDRGELAMSRGVLPARQLRLVAAGSAVRVAVGGRP